VRCDEITCLWSRGEELINEAFPELVAMAEILPPGTVIDGEVIVWSADEAVLMGFASLQRRLGRKRVPASLLRDCPARLIAYDLLEHRGVEHAKPPVLATPAGSGVSRGHE